MLFIYQIFGVVASLIVIFLASKQFQKENLSPRMYVIWLILWVAVIFISLFPEFTEALAEGFGIGRGLDFIIIIAIIIGFYIMFKLYNQINDQKCRLDELISELAVEKTENNEK